MGKSQKYAKENGLCRLTIAGIVVSLQFLWFMAALYILNQYFVKMEIVIHAVAIFLALLIIGNVQNCAFKETWLFVILTVPLFGVALYFLLGNSVMLKGIRRQYQKMGQEFLGKLPKYEGALESFCQLNQDYAGIANYLSGRKKFPIYANRESIFYTDAAAAFVAQMEAIRDAKEFVFIEYFAVEDGCCFGQMLELLQQKVKDGIEVRILYDDIGSAGFVSGRFKKKLKRMGIACRTFNPVLPFLKIFLNNRDHRKLMIIDGTMAFIGGYNLTDEYFNVGKPYGLWKDSGVRITGNAVATVTGMFLEMWNFVQPSDADVGNYMKKFPPVASADAYVQPYSDCPLEDERIGENVYLNMIACARKSLYICTPYLAIGEDMTKQLILAAQRGVDVRIVIPGVPDKRLVYALTKSYVPRFVQNGVKVYRFVPGFIHAKQMLADGRAATVGTVNMDFRSFCHQFENGVFFYGGDVIAQMERDFAELFHSSEEITVNSQIGRLRRIGPWQCILRLIAPLL